MGLHIGLVSPKSYRPYNRINMEAEAQHLSRELSEHKMAVSTPETRDFHTTFVLLEILVQSDIEGDTAPMKNSERSR